MRHLLALLLLFVLATFASEPAQADAAPAPSGAPDAPQRPAFQLRRAAAREPGRPQSPRSLQDPETGEAVWIATPLRSLLAQAHAVHPRDIEAEAGIDLAQPYDVRIRPGAVVDAASLRALLSAGLSKALRIEISHAPRHVPVNRLRRREGEPALPASTAQARRMTVHPGRVEALGVSMRELVIFLRWRTPRPILDETGLAATYDFVLEWDPSGGTRAMLLALHDLGLEFVRGRGEFPLLVVRPAS